MSDGLGTLTPAPPAPTAWDPGGKVPVSAEVVQTWQKRIERAQTTADQFYPQWERALTRYAEAKVSAAKTDINALLDYRHVESKKAQLFHKTPEINLSPVDPADPAVPYDAILPLR